MPLKRTPPKTPASSESDTNKSTCRQLPPNSSIAEGETLNGRKRKRNNNNNDCSISMEEIHELLKSHKTQTDNKLKSLQTAMSEIITQNTDIKNTIDFISKQYDDMVAKTEKLEADRKSDRTYINQLEERLENLERLLNLSKIEIKNIPKKQGENKADLCKFVKETASVLDVSLKQQDIKDVYRLNKKEGLPTIIVDFTSTTMKEEVLKGVRQFNKRSTGDKLNTTLIQIEGPSKPIFISESLPAKAQRLYYLARNFARNNGYKFCWTSLGKVFLRKVEGGKQILIKNEADINNLNQNI